MRVLMTSSEYFNSLNRSEKAQIKRFITELGYVEAHMLSMHIQECGLAKRFNISTRCLKEVIKHYASI
ncbi:hypothetical protein PWKp18_00135 [Klebsiella phage PWKp18]|nr:hypothetical protein PWKp18_00135 [Klebsiella phage PWKp18]